jgi:transposase-like protein
MFTLSESLPDEGWCAKVLRNVRWNSFAVCPHCNSLQVKKDGYYRSYQKYFCKECKRWFNDKTGTIFHYSHTPLKAWFLALYLFFVLWPGCSIHETSLEVRVSYYRCYKFIRSVMKRLTSSSSALGSVKLGPPQSMVAVVKSKSLPSVLLLQLALGTMVWMLVW